MAIIFSSGVRRCITGQTSAAANPVELLVSPMPRLLDKYVAAVRSTYCYHRAPYHIRRRISHRAYSYALHPCALHKANIQKSAAHASVRTE